MKTNKAIKLKLRLSLRFLQDMLTFRYLRFASKTHPYIHYNHEVMITQEIKTADGYENKVFNISHVAKCINEVAILPHEIFSFWHIVGNPNIKLQPSRVIRNGKIINEIGGGICQVTGIIYYISMMVGLEVIERHNHSIDIYTDKTRFTPLGTDATVVYGYKDLRICNTYPFPIKFKIIVLDKQLMVSLLSTEKIEANQLTFNTETYDETTTVRVFSIDGVLLNTSTYKKMLK